MIIGPADMQALSPRPTELGGFTIRRLLPQRPRRMVGAWCFLDLLGPVSVGGDRALDVPPHPHIGLQTVTWVLAGEALHKDSLGSEAVARPGTLNLMTSGGGIAHSEETPARGAGPLHLVQLWIAQPDADRGGPPSFDHHADRPVLELPGGRATIILGTLGGIHAPARLFSALVGADLAVDPGREVTVPLARGFEHALVPLAGRCAAEADALARDHLYYLEPGRDGVAVRALGDEPARVLVIGGAPFGESILMWWNFVARTTDEVAAARDDWEAGRRFGEVRAYEGARLAAPRFLARPVPANPMS
jgi:redox-sensitive bicupin YhaK (pirin superfamily)